MRPRHQQLDPVNVYQELLTKSMLELPRDRRDNDSLRVFFDGVAMLTRHDLEAAGASAGAVQPEPFSQGLREVFAGGKRRRRRRRRRDTGAVEHHQRLAGALTGLNEILRFPAISSWLPELRNHLTAQTRMRAFIERVLQEPADERGTFLLPPWTTEQSLWARVLELTTVTFVVDDLADHHGDDEWPRMALRGLSNGVPVGPPFRTPPWFPAFYEPVRRLAMMLLDVPLDLLQRIGRCRYDGCWTGAHSCPLSPYFVDRSPSTPHHRRLTCCQAHRTAQSRACNGSADPRKSSPA